MKRFKIYYGIMARDSHSFSRARSGSATLCLDRSTRLWTSGDCGQGLEVFMVHHLVDLCFEQSLVCWCYLHYSCVHRGVYLSKNSILFFTFVKKL